MKADLLDPAADVEGIGKANHAINDRQVDGMRRSRRKTPGEQSHGENGNAVGSQCDGVVAEPAAAVGDIAVRIVHFEAGNLSEEDECKQQVSELMGELHQPLNVGAYAGDDKHGKERHKTQQQILVEHQPLPGDSLPLVGFDEYADGYNQQGGKDKASEDVADNAQCFLYAAFKFHVVLPLSK